MPPLLLLHGALGAKDQFEPLLPLLPPSLPVFRLNLAGHGGEPFPEEDSFSIETFVDQLLAWLQAQDLGPVWVFGYSMGGYIALEAARREPSRFAGIFTLATKFTWSPEAAMHETAKLNPEVIEAKVPAFAQALQQRHAPQDWRQVVKNTAVLMEQLGQNPLLSPEALSQITLPVRIAVGDRDQMVTIEESLSAYRQLPQAQFQVLPATKHPLEQLDWPLLESALRHFFNYA
ncbi:alpha/beta fold hydrolase [Rufibacter soli]